MLYSLVSIVCCVILGIIGAGYLIAICRKHRSRRVEFVRKFKKGNCAIVYVVAIPLYWIGMIYKGEGILPAFFTAINRTMSLVVLRYDLEDILPLMEVNFIYAVSVYFCFVLVAVNAMLFAASLFSQKIWEWLERIWWSWFKKDKLLIVGCNEDNYKIYFSAQKSKKRGPMIIDSISGKDKEKMYAKKIRFISKKEYAIRAADVNKPDYSDEHPLCGSLLDEAICGRFEKALGGNGSCVIVINTKDDNRNIDLCQSLIAYLNYYKNKISKTVINAEGNPEKKIDKAELAKAYKRAKVYVFGAPEFETIYRHLVALSDGCIRYVDKYNLVAMDFVARYPLTEFMTEKEINTERAILRSDAVVSMTLIGFGKTNQQVFLTSVANSQFVTAERNKLTEREEIVFKPIEYHIFDKQFLANSKNINHNYSRYEIEFEDEIEEQKKNGTSEHSYLPLPEPPAKRACYKLDVNDPAFYKAIKKVLGRKNSYNYVVIAFGSDLENVDMASKLIDKRQEWGLENTYIFVKVRSGDASYSIFRNSHCFLIGDEDKVVYNINEIDGTLIEDLAIVKNRVHHLEKMLKKGGGSCSESIESVYDEADYMWYHEKSQNEKESNLYQCLSMRAKLHLMGLDYCSKAAEDGTPVEGIDYDKYKDIYAAGDKIEYKKYLADGKPIVDFDEDFLAVDQAATKRGILAIGEHYRWNSFMISHGTVPATKKQIYEDKKNNGKSYALRRHGNLTTMDGLIEFRRMIAARDSKPEIACDVIKYDYRLLDDAYWLLTKCDKVIVMRKKN
ncbi:MAG: hypothetical protein IJF33_05975 [Clostridia bacterium]|nr:hypothetical protein [Clostridia bacterium]